MRVMQYQSEAQYRALDAQCGDLASPAACRAIRELRAMSAENQIICANNYAIFNCNNLLRCTLEAGVSARSYSQGSPLLCIAAEKGSLRPMLTLLAAGADVNARSDGLGNTALIMTIIHKRPECCRAMLEVSDLSLTNRMGFNALHVCVNTASHECFELLLPRVVDVDARTVSGMDEHGAPLDEATGTTALIIACMRGQHDMVKALLKRGASRTATDSKGFSLAMYAAKYGHLSCLNLILGKEGRYKLSPVQVNAADVYGHTALHMAAFFGHAKCCGLLIAAGARLDVKLLSGHTPLILAQQEHPANAGLLDMLAGRGPAVMPGTGCDHCGATSGPDGRSVKICNGCHSARFCGAACYAAAWPAHKAECRRKAAEREAATKPRLVQQR